MKPLPRSDSRGNKRKLLRLIAKPFGFLQNSSKSILWWVCAGHGQHKVQKRVQTVSLPETVLGVGPKVLSCPLDAIELPSADFQATHGYVWVCTGQTSRRRGLRGPKIFVEITLSHIQQEWFDVWVFLEFEGPVKRIGFPFLRGHLAGKTVASTRGCSRVLDKSQDCMSQVPLKKVNFCWKMLEDHIPPWHPMATKLLNSPVYRGLGPMGQAWRPEGPRDPPHWGHDAWSQVGCRACLRMVSENQWIGFRVLVFLTSGSELKSEVVGLGVWLNGSTEASPEHFTSGETFPSVVGPWLWRAKDWEGVGDFSGLLDQQMIPKVGLIQYNPFPEYSIPQYSSPGFMIESIHVWLPHWLYNQGEGIAKIWGLDGIGWWSLRRYILAIEEILVQVEGSGGPKTSRLRPCAGFRPQTSWGVMGCSSLFIPSNWLGFDPLPKKEPKNAGGFAYL